MPLVGLSFGPAAAAFLDAMPPGKLRAQIAKKAKALLLEPHPPGCKKLVNILHCTEAVWRVRSGDYRILYVARPSEVLIIDIGDRKDIYR